MNTSSPSASESTGFFGAYGGQFVPDELKVRLDEVTEAFERYRDNSFFKDELDYYFKHYTGRPNPIFFCANLSERLGGAKIYLKREDLNHLGAHKINNTLGQCLLAKRMGKKRIVAETGAGQHGVATAATAALLGLECTVYMGAEEHDLHAAYVSHISHITSFALALTVLEKEREERHIFDLAGGGFESTVRLAKSSAATWVPIMLRNKYNLLDVLREHIHQLQIMRRMIERDDAEGLTSAFGKANSIQRIIH